MPHLRSCLISSALVLNAGALAQSAPTADLSFDAGAYRLVSMTLNGQAVRFRAYERVVYVRRPLDPATQSMNIYVPEAYFQGQSIGAYSAQTAPIFLPNQIGGYMPAEPGTPSDGSGQMGPGPGGPNAILIALSRGYVVASPGARGRTSQNAAGEYIGKAPAAIVDLKAAVRYLRFNDAAMPGTAEKIISNGTSAGGAMSALLGATGNNRDYAAYLSALGAADARDDIYAVSAYCPITNLEHADAAYEWQFNGVNGYQKLLISKDTSFNIQRTLVSGTLTADEIAVSNALKPLFPAYLNSLGLRQGDQPLTLDEGGNGSFKTYMASLLQASAQGALDAGQDLSTLNWLTVANGKVTAVDFDAYARAAGRMKVPPAFDGLSLDNAENEEFGTTLVNARHFTAFSQQQSKVAAAAALPQTVKLMNPMNYVGQAGTQTAKYWRIRAGTADRDTSLAVSAMLATKLANTGQDVNYALPWNVPHSGDYDLNELFAWMDRVAAQ